MNFFCAENSFYDYGTDPTSFVFYLDLTNGMVYIPLRTSYYPYTVFMWFLISAEVPREWSVPLYLELSRVSLSTISNNVDGEGNRVL